jgi:hypothetical protein
MDATFNRVLVVIFVLLAVFSLVGIIPAAT